MDWVTKFLFFLYSKMIASKYWIIGGLRNQVLLEITKKISIAIKYGEFLFEPQSVQNLSEYNKSFCPDLHENTEWSQIDTLKPNFGHLLHGS